MRLHFPHFNRVLPIFHQLSVYFRISRIFQIFQFSRIFLNFSNISYFSNFSYFPHFSHIFSILSNIISNSSLFPLFQQNRCGSQRYQKPSPKRSNHCRSTQISKRSLISPLIKVMKFSSMKCVVC